MHGQQIDRTEADGFLVERERAEGLFLDFSFSIGQRESMVVGFEGIQAVESTEHINLILRCTVNRAVKSASRGGVQSQNLRPGGSPLSIAAGKNPAIAQQVGTIPSSVNRHELFTTS
jgi:hypothetical protein